tara:strand:+ start:2844 stop:4142 length:1299 start_codon:yes stop_codon:yes gene_type:complete
LNNYKYISGKSNTKDIKIGVVGLGYVGLPLALAFAKIFNVIGFDLNKERIKGLRNGFDKNNDINKTDFLEKDIFFTDSEKHLRDVNFFVISVPTPVDDNKVPNLDYLIKASKLVSKYLNKGDFIIYESTVYPGATESICLPIILKETSLQLNTDFYLGYSPERINPGDKSKTIDQIVKVTSGSCPEAADYIDAVYKSIIKAGTLKASSIKVAEAAKVIENIQRDVNIALFNELAQIFNKLGIDSKDVFQAAASKWNFHNYQPGLVGGHCIGVDPYYMTYLCEQIQFQPKIINAGRAINDSMAKYVSSKFFRILKENVPKGSIHVLIIGASFKENCSDIRNSKVFEIYGLLANYGCLVDIIDEYVDEQEVYNIYKLKLNRNPKKNFYDGLLLAVPHDIYLDKGINFIKSFGKPDCIFFDLKSIYKKGDSQLRL